MLAENKIMSIFDKKDLALKDYLETDSDNKYRYLINKGRDFIPLESSLKIDKFKIDGCQSQVWISPEFKEGKLFFKAEAEAAIIKGIVAILLEIYNDNTPNEILSLDIDFLTDSGLVKNLSMTRSNGVLQVVKQIKMYALVFKALSK